MDQTLQEGPGEIVRKTPKSLKSPNSAKSSKPASTATPKPAPKTKRAAAAKADDHDPEASLSLDSEAPIEIASASAGPKGKRSAKTPAAAKTAPITSTESAPPPPRASESAKAVKAAIEASAPAPQATPKGSKVPAGTGLTTATGGKGGIEAENHSYKVAFASIPKLLECVNPRRIFCNMPPGLLSEVQEAHWKEGMKAGGITCLKYVKQLETLHERMGNRANHRILLISGWLADPKLIDPIFGEDQYTYVFMYPNNIRGYAERLIAGGTPADKAKEMALTVKQVYQTHLEEYQHAVLTALVDV